MKDYCIQLAKAQVEQIGWKAPLPLFCLLVRHLAQIMWHDVTSRTDLSCIIELHIGGDLAEKPPPRMREIFLTPDLSISGNFEQLWFWWQKSPPPFQAILSNFGFCGRKAPPPPPRMRENFWLQIYPFQAISSNFGFCGRKAPPPIHVRQFQATLDEGKFFDTDLSISGNFEQLWFLWQKSPPPLPRMRENFLTSDLSISGNFEQLWFLWQKSPPPPRMRENFLTLRSIHFRQFWATLVFVAEKPPPPRMRENFLTSDLSISGNFEQLWFLWQKSPPPPPRMRENFLTSDLSISGNFKQLWFLWQKSPPWKLWLSFFITSMSLFFIVLLGFFCGVGTHIS